jgi:Large eukaryotic DNA virus major capsid protein
MSTGAVFKLIANDGKMDRLIVASSLLMSRIQSIIHDRTASGKADITPTLQDLEKTHILYMNAHFKPYAAIGYEYAITKPEGGTVALGSTVTFSIPQFGDFFHDMVCRVRLGQANANTGTTPVQSGTPNSGSVFPFNSGGYSYNLVDQFGKRLVTGVSSGTTPTVSYQNFVRYCEYPGHRLFAKVRFDVNGNPLDEYTSDVPMMLNKFTVMPHKRHGHNKLVGQQVPMDAVSGLQTSGVYDADNSVPGWNQYPVSYKGATAGVMPTALTSYNTPAGINKTDVVQSNQTVGMAQPTLQTVAYDDEVNDPAGLQWTSASIATSVPATINFNTQALVQTTVASPAAGDVSNVVYGANQVDYSQRVSQVVNGPQVSRPIQPPLEIWNKLKFWFNDDVKLSIPSVSIPFGQRFIHITLTDAGKLLYEDASVFVETIQSMSTVSGIGNILTSVITLSSSNTASGTVTSPIAGSINLIYTIPGMSSTTTTFNVISATYLGSNRLQAIVTNGSNLVGNVIFITSNTIYPYNVTGVLASGTGSSNLYTTAWKVGTTTNVAIDESVLSVTAQNIGTISAGGIVYSLISTSPNPTLKSPSATGLQLNAVGQSQPLATNMLLFGSPYVTTPASAYPFTGTIDGGTVASLLNMTPPASREIRTYAPYFQCNGVATPTIQNVELYINNIFVNPEIHDIFIKRIGFSLIRVYRIQRTTVKNTDNQILLHHLKWPIEYMYVGAQPSFNTKDVQTSAGVVTGGNVNVWRDWHRMTRQAEATMDEAVVATTAISGSSRAPVMPTKYYLPVSTVDSLSLVSHGIPIYNAYSDMFFTAYAPYHYGEQQVVTPEDTGAFFINMSLFPRTYQPSGHLNISRVRETYINFKSSYCSASTTVVVIVVAIAINFLLVSDGSAVLRYST